MNYNSYDDLTDSMADATPSLDDFIRKLRNKNIFDQYGQPTSSQVGSDDPTNRGGPPQPIAPPNVPMPQGQMAPAPMQAKTPEDLTREELAHIAAVYTPEHTASDRLNKLLDEFPNEDDYKPSIGRRLVSIGVGLGKGGSEAQDKYLDEPYVGEVAKWKERAGPYQQAATLENQQNINERNLATNVFNNETAIARNETQARTAQAKQDEITRHNTETEAISRKLAQVKQFLAENPEWKADYSSTTVKVFNPRTHEVIDSGVATDKLDEWQRLTLQGQYKVEAAREQGAAAATVATIRGTQTYHDDEGNLYQVDQGGKRTPVGDAPPEPVGQLVPEPKAGAAGTKTTPVTLKSYDEARQIRMQELVRKYPETKKFFNIDEKGNYSFIDRPVEGTGRWNPFVANVEQSDVDAWDEAYKAVNPDYVIPPKKGQQAQTTPTAAAAPTEKPINTSGFMRLKQSFGDFMHPGNEMQAADEMVQKAIDESMAAQAAGPKPVTKEVGPAIGKPPRSMQEMLKPGEVLVEDVRTGEPIAMSAKDAYTALNARKPDGSPLFVPWRGGK